MKYIAYYRVSTQKQGESGLGLEAQRKAVDTHLNGAAPLMEFTEIETGKNNQRPTLAEAIAKCKRHKATLIIAKLDRLARNVHFISGLMESGIDFIAADNPNATKLTIHILAAVAEDEAERISKRTKEALAAAKARGVKLGGSRGYKPTAEDRQKAVEARRAASAELAQDLQGCIRDIRARGGVSFRGIARELTARGVPTPTGKTTWQAITVQRLIAAGGS